jgi:hypothetical protein
MSSCARRQTILEGDCVLRALAAIDAVVRGGERR